MRKRRSLLELAIAGLVTSTACTGPAPAGDDADQDGVSADDGDCDDFNNTIAPDASEIAGDGVDQDCDGEDLVLTDVDGDGVSAADGDCDDRNPTVFRGARERSRDGVDSNCDGEDQPLLGDDQYAAALGVMDTDTDGAISFAEFEVACAASAAVDGSMRPGVVQTHSSCSGTNSCRGLILHPWNEVYVHDCRGINGCAGWSCVEAAEDQGRTGEAAYSEAGCVNCHLGTDGAFKVLVPPGLDVDATVATFLDRSDTRLRSAIAFGLSGISPGDVAYVNMPGHYQQLSRREVDAVVAYVRTLELEGESFAYGDTPPEEEAP